MAIPLSKLLLTGHNWSIPTTTIPRSFCNRRSQCSIGKIARKRIIGSIKASKTDDSLSTVITKFEKGIQEQELQEEVESREDNDHKEPKKVLANSWREINGQSDWEGLLDPIDPLLRTELIRYGELAQATYDSFDFDPTSTYCGFCKYHRREFFEKLGMSDSGYEVTRYLYATATINFPSFLKKSNWSEKWSSSANWMGYVAMSDDNMSARLGRQDIAVAWRGTVTRLEWVADLMDYLKPVSSVGIPTINPAIEVELGFLELYTERDHTCWFSKYSARQQVLAEVKRLLTENNETQSITITGHSLGSALAILSAYDIAESGVNVLPDGRVVPITVFSFSGPRVGNGRFKERCEELGVKVLRVFNVHDTVPKVPGILFNEHVPKFVQDVAEWLPWYYSHVGVELELDHKKSPFLKETNDPAAFHNLEAHLHLLDGYHGKGEKFVLASGRDPALVNKSADFLKEQHLVPPFWRQDENKGMVKNEEGKWVQPERPRLVDDHPPEEIDAQLQKIPRLLRK